MLKKVVPIEKTKIPFDFEFEYEDGTKATLRLIGETEKRALQTIGVLLKKIQDDLSQETSVEIENVVYEDIPKKPLIIKDFKKKEEEKEVVAIPKNEGIHQNPYRRQEPPKPRARFLEPVD